jgi:hypothetical protein
MKKTEVKKSRWIPKRSRLFVFFVNADSLLIHQHIAEVNSTAVFKLSASRKRKILSFRSETIDPHKDWYLSVRYCTFRYFPRVKYCPLAGVIICTVGTVV